MSNVKEQTIRELCNRVAATHMLDKMDDETVVAYQDLIGHATIEENRELANDPALMETFYWIYGASYGTVAAIKFYMQNSYKVSDMKDELALAQATIEEKDKSIHALENAISKLTDKLNDTTELINTVKDKAESMDKLIEERDKEILTLKAKLYDAQNTIRDYEQALVGKGDTNEP